MEHMRIIVATFTVQNYHYVSGSTGLLGDNASAACQRNPGGSSGASGIIVEKAKTTFGNSFETGGERHVCRSTGGAKIVGDGDRDNCDGSGE